MPIVFSIFGFAVFILCLWFMKKIGFAALKRKFREVVAEDKETFDSSDKID